MPLHQLHIVVCGCPSVLGATPLYSHSGKQLHLLLSSQIPSPMYTEYNMNCVDIHRISECFRANYDRTGATLDIPYALMLCLAVLILQVFDNG